MSNDYPHIHKSMLDLRTYLDTYEVQINDEVLHSELYAVANGSRPKLTAEEMSKLRANSWGHHAIYLACDNEALIQRVLYATSNCQPPARGFPTSVYDESVAFWLVPILLERLQEAEHELSCAVDAAQKQLDAKQEQIDQCVALLRVLHRHLDDLQPLLEEAKRRQGLAPLFTYDSSDEHTCVLTREDRDGNTIPPTCVITGKSAERCPGTTPTQDPTA